MLAKRGHHVTVVDDGRRAVEAAIDGTFDLVLMDVQMPEMSGLEAPRRFAPANAAPGGVCPSWP